MTRLEKQFAASMGLLWLAWLVQYGSREQQEEIHAVSKDLFASFGVTVPWGASFADLAVDLLREWAEEAKK